MRIVAGEFKGRPFKAPEGRATRPTTDRIREAIMSSLSSECESFEGLVVLDAFAGSGAFGFESLSRGCARVVAYERDKKAIACIRANAASFSLPKSRYELIERDIFLSLPKAVHEPFDLLFFDPPYDTHVVDIARLIAQLSESELLAPDAVLVYEQAKSNQISANQEACDLVEQAGFSFIRQKKYGETILDYYRRDRA